MPKFCFKHISEQFNSLNRFKRHFPHVLQRERDAVNEWLESNKTFHVMRDHPWQGSEILAGMWGGWNRYNDKYRVLRQQMLGAVNPIGKVGNRESSFALVLCVDFASLINTPSNSAPETCGDTR